MSFGSIIQAVLRFARVALASILLVGVPLAEAATCGGEVSQGVVEATGATSIATTVAAEDSGAHHDKTGGDAQHCIHGHCHHSTPFKSNDLASLVVLEASAAMESMVSAAVLTHISSGLERPPKA